MLIRREDLRNRLVRLIAHGRLVITTRTVRRARRLSRFLFMQTGIQSQLYLAQQEQNKEDDQD
jgi:hypothetical protein